MLAHRFTLGLHGLRGIGQADMTPSAVPQFCAPDFVGPLSPEQSQECVRALQKIQSNLEAGIAYRDVLLSQQPTQPDWTKIALIGGGVLVGVMILSSLGGRRR